MTSITFILVICFLSLMDIESNSDSERKLASIQRVVAVSKHQNADSLELATILGWQVVTRVGEVKPGDVVIYCEIDSMLPGAASWLPEAVKQRIEQQKDKEWYRIKTIKLRKEISQGLIIPRTNVTNRTIIGPDPDVTTRSSDGIAELSIGSDVTEILGIRKYEPPALSGKYAMFNTNSQQKFPSHLLQKTDEIRVQSEPSLFRVLAGQPYYYSVKMDGTSGTFLMVQKVQKDVQKQVQKDMAGPSHLPETEAKENSGNEQSEETEDTEFLVCSRNLVRSRPENLKVCPYWYVAQKYNLEEKLRANPHYAIQGEVCGPNVQGNLAKLSDLDLFVFNVVDLRDGTRLPYPKFLEVCNDLELTPVIVEEVGESFEYNTIEQLLEKAKGKYKNTKNEREGIVIRSWDQSITFKVINNNYLLKQK